MFNSAKFIKTMSVAIVMGSISACSSTHPYKSSLHENMSIATDVQKGTANLNVYDIGSACHMTYQGTVDLSEKKVKVALPTNKPLYLVFVFSSDSFFTGSSSNSYGTYVTLRPGNYYESTVTFVDSMYGATIYERDMHGGGRNKIPYAAPPCETK